MIVQGRLLIDPAAPAEPGWVRLEGDRIAEVMTGEPPRDLMPPDAGGRDAIVCPAFTDAHIHLPQIDAAGCDGMRLLEWLERVVFPAESWWGAGGAVPSARTAVRRMLGQGTTGFGAYLTSHAEGSLRAVEYLRTMHVRFIAGRVAMDRGAPADLVAEDRGRVKRRPPPSPMLAELGADDRRAVSVNPRFAVSCSDELLAEIGWLVRERPGTWVQTHLAESPAECERVMDLFRPTIDPPHYAGVYDHFGLLTDRTILAHCVHLSDEEWRLIAERRCIVAHCPTANLFLMSGLFDLDRAREHGVRLALGSDVAGGPDVAMPRVARAMIETAKARRLLGAGGKHIPSPAEAWSMITAGNAELLGWPRAGRLEPGGAADLLVLRAPESWMDEHLVGRLIYNWDGSLIEARVVNGRMVDPATI